MSEERKRMQESLNLLGYTKFDSSDKEHRYPKGAIPGYTLVEK